MGVDWNISPQPEEEMPRPATVLENSIADADNIDRFDAWRLARRLCWDDLEKLHCRELGELAQGRVARAGKLRSIPFATETGRKMWNECLDLWAAVYKRLADQMDVTLSWDKDI